MNFLAHAFLAGDVETDRVGGVLGDFVKGPLPAGLPAGLAAGVALHRAIDSFADRHPAFAASRARISPPRRRVSGILVDLFYDHLLARDWEHHGTGPLEGFTTRLYAALRRFDPWLPPRAREVAERMHTQDWLTTYRDPDAVARAIDRMAIYRMRRANPLAGGITEFLADPDGFAADFAAFLPDAKAFADQWRIARDAPLPGRRP